MKNNFSSKNKEEKLPKKHIPYKTTSPIENISKKLFFFIKINEKLNVMDLDFEKLISLKKKKISFKN